MSDPTMDTLSAFLEKGFYSIAVILGLVTAVKWLSERREGAIRAHLSALNARIEALEAAFGEALVREREAAAREAAKAEAHAVSLANVSLKMASAVRDNAAVLNRAITVFGDAMDRVSPAIPPLPPRASDALERKHPSRQDLPACDPPTETMR